MDDEKVWPGVGQNLVEKSPRCALLTDGIGDVHCKQMEKERKRRANFCHKNGHEAVIHKPMMKRGCLWRGVRHGTLCAWKKIERGLGFSIRMTRDTEISTTYKTKAKYLRFAVESGRGPTSGPLVLGKLGVCALMHNFVSPPTQRSVVLARVEGRSVPALTPLYNSSGMPMRDHSCSPPIQEQRARITYEIFSNSTGRPRGEETKTRRSTGSFA